MNWFHSGGVFVLILQIGACGKESESIDQSSEGQSDGSGGMESVTQQSTISESSTNSDSQATDSSTISTTMSTNSDTSTVTKVSSCTECIAQACAVNEGCCDGQWSIFCNEFMKSCNSDCISNSGGTCHDVCETGGSIGVGCDVCVATICDERPSCCTEQWDDECVANVSMLCGKACTGSVD